MISYRAKCLLAAASVLALIATVSVARTVQNHPPSADQPRVSNGSAVGAASGQMQSMPNLRHGIIVCGMALNSDCGKFETLLPM
jgi:hypothetical protein